MKTVRMLKGLPASGKSTWARAEVDKLTNSVKRVNKDDLRAMLDNGKHSKGNESFVITIRDAIIWHALEEGKHVIIDDTNLNPVHEQNIRKLVSDFTTRTGKQVSFEVVEFNTSVDECIRRDALRENSVGEKVIRNHYNRWIKPNQKVGKLEQDPSLPKAIICDLDGTLALLNGRDPYDASTCEQDELNVPVADIVKNYTDIGYEVILFSGRSGKYENETRKWLAKHGIPFYMLRMRPEGDSRKDADLKREMYEDNVSGKFYIQFVLDDRNQVVDLWREIGLTCLQVAPGDF